MPGEFTVNSDGKKVKFSRGNLQYHSNSGNWRFAENQYDAIRNQYGNANSSDKSNVYWMDLLAWGTSAHQVQADANNKYYFPWHYTNYGAVNSTYNTYGYGPSINIGNGNLTDAGGILDWGVSNAIANGGNQIGKWRTLTADEWEYIFNNTSRTDLRYCFARITGVKWRDGYDYLVADNANVNGMILFPDSYIHPTTEGVPAISNANNPRRYFTDNPISAFGWSAMEAAGAVFLPAGGVREANSIYQWNADVMYENNENNRDQNNWGRYWTATKYNQYTARIVWFYYGHLWPNYGYYEPNEDYWYDGNSQFGYYQYHWRWNPYRYRGYSVRLVQDIN